MHASIIVVTYNSERFIAGCLDSVLEHTEGKYEIIAIDNGSSDASAAVLREYAKRNRSVKALIHPANVGFSAANNVGVRASSGDWIVLLNADTVVTSGWLFRVVQHFEADPTLGLLVPVTNYAGNETMIACDYSSIGEMHDFAARRAAEQRGREHPLDVAPLYCTLMRRSLWDEIGPLDEQFAVGMFEDDDYSLRVREAGYRVAAAEDVFVHHYGRGSFEGLADYEQVFAANRQRYERKWNLRWRPHQWREGIIEPNPRIAAPAG